MARVAPGAIQERYKRIIHAWETLFPGKSFGGFDLAQLKALSALSDGDRDDIADLDTQMAGAIQSRDDHDDAVLEALELIINGVRADKSVGGGDGALYKEMGFVPKSQRKPQVRKPKPAP
jgi:hypothetical protein